jgi:hypothetical protein
MRETIEICLRAPEQCPLVGPAVCRVRGGTLTDIQSQVLKYYLLCNPSPSSLSHLRLKCQVAECVGAMIISDEVAMHTTAAVASSYQRFAVWADAAFRLYLQKRDLENASCPTIQNPSDNPAECFALSGQLSYHEAEVKQKLQKRVMKSFVDLHRRALDLHHTDRSLFCTQWLQSDPTCNALKDSLRSLCEASMEHYRNQFEIHLLQPVVLTSLFVDEATSRTFPVPDGEAMEHLLAFERLFAAETLHPSTVVPYLRELSCVLLQQYEPAMEGLLHLQLKLRSVDSCVIHSLMSNESTRTQTKQLLRRWVQSEVRRSVLLLNKNNDFFGLLLDIRRYSEGIPEGERALSSVFADSKPKRGKGKVDHSKDAIPVMELLLQEEIDSLFGAEKPKLQANSSLTPSASSPSPTASEPALPTPAAALPAPAASLPPIPKLAPHEIPSQHTMALHTGRFLISLKRASLASRTSHQLSSDSLELLKTQVKAIVSLLKKVIDASTLADELRDNLLQRLHSKGLSDSYAEDLQMEEHFAAAVRSVLGSATSNLFHLLKDAADFRRLTTAGNTLLGAVQLAQHSHSITPPLDSFRVYHQLAVPSFPASTFLCPSLAPACSQLRMLYAATFNRRRLLWLPSLSNVTVAWNLPQQRQILLHMTALHLHILEALQLQEHWRGKQLPSSSGSSQHLLESIVSQYHLPISALKRCLNDLCTHHIFVQDPSNPAALTFAEKPPAELVSNELVVTKSIKDQPKIGGAGGEGAQRPIEPRFTNRGGVHKMVLLDCAVVSLLKRNGSVSLPMTVALLPSHLRKVTQQELNAAVKRLIDREFATAVGQTLKYIS